MAFSGRSHQSEDSVSDRSFSGTVSEEIEFWVGNYIDQYHWLGTKRDSRKARGDTFQDCLSYINSQPTRELRDVAAKAFWQAFRFNPYLE